MKYFSKNIVTEDQLKKQYRQLAMQYHPDKEGGNVEIMQEINKEHEQLQRMISGDYRYTINNNFGFGQTDFFRRTKKEQPAYRSNVNARRGEKMDWRDFINKDDD